MTRRSKSSKRWLEEHFSDVYVKKAQEQGYRSRAVFKLKELLEKDQLLKPGMRVIDLGAAPGGWTQVIAELIGKTGKVWAVDILPMDPIPGVEIIQGDLTTDETFNQLWDGLGHMPVDIILSDMAPNMSGMAAVDQPRVMHLAEWVLELTEELLKPDGTLVIKLFQGEGYDAYLKALRQKFSKVIIRKPSASRKRSNEVYLVAKGRKTVPVSP